MGKNRKRKTAAQPPGPGPQPGMRPPPPPPHGGFRGPAPVRPMGPPGQRFPVPHHDFGPQPPRMMMMDDEPFHPMDFPDRHEFHPPFDGPDPRFRHPEFENRPPHFYHPEMDYGPRFCDRPPDFCPPEFDDRPPDFCPPEFRGRPPNFHPAEFEGGPGFHRMNPGFDPMEQYGPRDPYYMPQMDVHGNHAFGDRGVFAGPPPPDFRGPGPVQPPPEVFNAANNCGYIEREDLKKFSFVFDAFFGSRAHLVPGVKVHFTVVKNLGKECAVDVKVAPGGTEDIDSTVYEGVVLTALPFDSKDANPGCIRTIISKDPIKLPFGKTDTNVTLLLYDRVEFQLLTNVITKEQRATNIKPKTPDTFQLTKEVRVMGVIINKSDGTLTVMTEKHDSLTGSAADSLSDEELNVMDEVELTVLTVNDTKKAIRLKKLPEGSVTFNQKGKSNENSSSAKDNTSSTTPVKDKMDNQEPALGLLVTTVEGTEKQLSFKSGDVITKATMMIGDKVQFNISINSVTSEECAVNVEILPETFQTDSEEHRKIGLVVKLDDNFGFIKTQQDPQLFFDVSEVMEDTKLTLSEKVEFTVIPFLAFAGKVENTFWMLKKMTIKLLKDPKDQVKDGVKTEDKGSESVNLERYRSSSHERRDSRHRHKRSRSRSKERGERYRRSRSRSRERSSQSARKRSRSPERYAKQSSSKDPSDKKRVKSPDNVDDELLRKRKELMELNELIARKKAIVAMEQNAKKIEPEDGKSGVTTFDYEHVHRENIWMPDLKPVKSILKKHSEPLANSQSQASASKETAASFIKSENQEMQIGYHQQTCAFGSNTPGYSTFESIAERTTAGSDKTSLAQIHDPELSDTTSVDEYGQPSPDGSSFAKPPSQKTAALPFNRSSNLQPIHSVTLGIFNRIMNESSAASQKTKTPPFNKPVIPQSLAQVASSRSLLEQKSPSVSKGSNSLDDQHRASSRLAQDHPPSSNPSTSQTSPSDPKRNLTTQMERFLSALNKADTSVVNSLFQEARKDLAVINTQKPPQRQLDRNIPFMDEIYDPFKEDEENDQPSFLGKQSGRERVKTETCLNDPSKDDLLPHERAIQDGSGFSRLVGMKYGVDPTAKAGHPMVSENWSAHKEDPNQFSEQWNPYEEDTELYATGHQRYTDERSLYKERSQSAEYQKVNSSAQHSYVEDREMPDSQFDKSLARQESEESSEDKDRKSENFEKIQSLLQTIGLHLDTAEVSKLADRTQERLYGKMRKPPSAPSHSFEQKRERSVSQTEQRGSSRADSSDSESLRSVSPAQSSNRKVYMSYKDSVKYKDQQKVEDVDLTSIKRTVVNLKPESDEQDPYEPEATAVSQALYQPMTAVTTVQSDSSQYAQSSTVPTYLASQYSQYQSSGQNSWGSVAPGLYPYGTVPPPPNLGYASGYQAMPPHMMSAYSSYTAPMPNPYCVPPPLSMPHPYGPPSFSAMASAYSNQAASEVSTESLKTKPVRCLKTIETVQTVPTTVPTTIQLGPARALVTIQPTEDSQANQTSEEAKNTQVATITEDDIKAKQKKRLEQFNQRMKLKKEQQMEAQRSRGQNRNSAPGKSTPNEIKNVWICGHSLVFWAEKRATSPEYGVQLGMHPDSVRIWWKGVQGMTWQQLVPVLHQLKDNWPKPDVLIIHLGGNDISTTAPEAFIETVKKDMTSLKSIFPRCLLVWSSILPRQSWRGTEDSKEMDIFRMAINERISDIMTELGGSALSHSNIRPSLGLYRPDGVHLSGKGIDTFNLNLQAFLEKWESETNKTETETSDPSA
ncbi:zinc finger protein 318-like [Labeo rohita]|uniref:Zinc finger protein 318-like n=1 Tax=Labeo rohita TaxID=84645 RepID=A0A498MH49_LABRO|nr:zinc finger protein 318-like [Labeo rohita]